MESLQGRACTDLPLLPAIEYVGANNRGYGRRPRKRCFRMISLPPLPPEAGDPQLRAFYVYWRGRAPDGRLPGRQHIDPLDVPALLPCLMLMDVVPQAAATPGSALPILRFRVRVAGGMLVDLIGANPTGQFLDDYVAESRRAQLNDAYTGVVRNRAAHYWVNQLWTPGREFVRVQRLALPLARDGETVDMVVACYARVEVPPPDGAMPDGLGAGGVS